MDIGQNTVKASNNTTNVVDLNAFRLQKQKSCAVSKTVLTSNIPTQLQGLIMELGQLVKEGEKKFLANL